MINWRKHWWKLLGVLILLYVFLGGLLVPLSPGIVSVSPNKAGPGEALKIEVRGYNSHFAEARALQAWLKLDSSYSLPATRVRALDNARLEASFQMPGALPDEGVRKPLTLILDNEIDGSSVLPAAVTLHIDSAGISAQGWSVNAVHALHARDHITFPYRNILAETIRNTYFHVPLWFAMMILFTASVIASIRYLSGKSSDQDLQALAFTRAGVLFGVLGLITGAIWARHTWGAYWSWDVKQNMSAIALLIYGAYFVLRNSMADSDSQARISAVYNIFAFVTLIPLLFVIPRLTDSLHPGNGGNPALGGEDLDNTMRLFFYPAIIGWTLLGVWIAQLSYRTEHLKLKYRNRL